MELKGEQELYRSRGCFGCGTENGAGLQIAPRWVGARAVAECTPREAHRGFSQTIHGGVIAAMLDEIIGVACGHKTGGKMITVELNVEFRAPVVIGRKVRLEGVFVRKRGRFIYGCGSVTDESGKTLAIGRGRFIAVDESSKGTFLKTTTR